MSKHTPGPWKAEKNGEVVCAQNGDKIADVKGWGRLQHKPDGLGELMSNARLIAAAPEMLEMLKELLNCWEEKGGFNTTRISKIFASGKINELLKKVGEYDNRRND